MAGQDSVPSAGKLLVFGDSVFAIAITLLALDIRIPDALPAAELGTALRHALPDVAAYVLSFAVIGALWIAHHGVFSMIGQLDRHLLQLDLALLAVIAALPFPTRLISEYGDTALATGIYAGSIAAAAALSTAMSCYLLRRPGRCGQGVTRERVKQSILRGLAITVVFASSLLIAPASPTAAKFWWLLAIPLRAFLARTRRA